MIIKKSNIISIFATILSLMICQNALSVRPSIAYYQQKISVEKFQQDVNDAYNAKDKVALMMLFNKVGNVHDNYKNIDLNEYILGLIIQLKITEIIPTLKQKAKIEAKLDSKCGIFSGKICKNTKAATPIYHIAILMLQNPDIKDQQKALLKLSTKRNFVGDMAANIIVNYEWDDSQKEFIIKKLSKVRTPGAQYAALKLYSKSLNERNKFLSYNLKVMEKNATYTLGDQYHNQYKELEAIRASAAARVLKENIDQGEKAIIKIRYNKLLKKISNMDQSQVPINHRAILSLYADVTGSPKNKLEFKSK
jgi:hypothetical protein